AFLSILATAIYHRLKQRRPTIIAPNCQEVQMAVSLRGLVLTVVIGSFFASSALALQTRPQNVSDGVYSEEQAKRGQTLYARRCANCHGNELAGRVGPPLAGNDFLAGWSSQPVLELANKIRRTMPKDDSERLTPQQTADVLAYMLQVA